MPTTVEEFRTAARKAETQRFCLNCQTDRDPNKGTMKLMANGRPRWLCKQCSEQKNGPVRSR